MDMHVHGKERGSCYLDEKEDPETHAQACAHQHTSLLEFILVEVYFLH